MSYIAEATLPRKLVRILVSLIITVSLIYSNFQISFDHFIEKRLFLNPRSN